MIFQISNTVAQHPDKLVWREKLRHGLSASQFGMALGHCGRVSDFVQYQREIVGTPLAFAGNECTDHGIRTESMARCCYELIMSTRVDNGGFYMSEDGVLGASPDGLIQLPDGTHRLLEIKSPFRSLYDVKNDKCKPHGIPKPYLCQMQGQMFLSGAASCDFFVFLKLDHEITISCIRVARCDEFWSWAVPKLRSVSRWIRDGLPDIIDRSFEFTPFDYSLIPVTPMIPPFCISTHTFLDDNVRFPLFKGALFPDALLSLGVFTFFGCGQSLVGALLNDTDVSSEDEASSQYVVESIDFDDSCVTLAKSDGQRTSMSFWFNKLHAFVIVSRQLSLPLSQPSQHMRCPPPSQLSLAPPGTDHQDLNACRPLEETLAYVMNAVDMRGIVYFESPGCGLSVWRKEVLQDDSVKAVEEIDGSADRFWVFFVDAVDVMDYHDLSSSTRIRVAEHEELLRCACDSSRDSGLVCAVVAGETDPKALTSILEEQLASPFVVVEGRWEEAAKFLSDRCFPHTFHLQH